MSDEGGSGDDDFGRVPRRHQLDPAEFEPPPGYKRRQRIFSRDPDPDPAAGAGTAGGLPKWMLPAVGVAAVIAGLVAVLLWQAGGGAETADPVPAEPTTASAADQPDQDANEDERDQALDTLPPSTLETLPSATLEPLPTTTVDPFLSDPEVPTTETEPDPSPDAAATTSSSDDCAETASEVAKAIENLFEVFKGRTVEQAASDLAGIADFDAEISPILDRGRALGCNADDIDLLCDAVRDLEPIGEASEIVYRSLTEPCPAP